MSSMERGGSASLSPHFHSLKNPPAVLGDGSVGEAHVR